MADAKVAREKVTTEIAENESVVVVKSEVSGLIDKMYNLQDDIENPSKFQRAVIFDAVLNFSKVYCAKLIGEWERVIDKAQKLRPTMTREQVIEELLVSKKAQEMKRRATEAEALKKTL